MAANVAVTKVSVTASTNYKVAVTKVSATASSNYQVAVTKVSVSASVDASRQIKVWNGTAWVSAVEKSWTGSIWK